MASALARRPKSPSPLHPPRGSCSTLHRICVNSSCRIPNSLLLKHSRHACFCPHPDERGRGRRDGPSPSSGVSAAEGLSRHPSVLRILKEENSLFRSLERSVPPVQWESLPLDRPVSIFQHGDSKFVLTCKAVPLGGDYPDYVSAGLRNNLAKDEAVIGLEFVQDGKKFFYAPSLSGRTDGWKCHANESDLALIDGTFWTDNELIDVRGSGKTAREIGHIPLSGPDGLLEQFPRDAKGRRVLIHLNNTNPALDESSAASQTPARRRLGSRL